MLERDLVNQYKDVVDKVNALKSELDELQGRKEVLQAEIIELLQSEGKDKTARYEGVGSIGMTKPRLSATVKKEDEKQLFSYLQVCNRTDLVKESVHPMSLSTFVDECIERGEQLPDFISIYYKSQLRFYKS